MTLLSIHPGVTIEDIKNNSGFNITIPENVQTTTPPTKKELSILKQIDPAGIVVGR